MSDESRCEKMLSPIQPGRRISIVTASHESHAEVVRHEGEGEEYVCVVEVVSGDTPFGNQASIRSEPDTMIIDSVEGGSELAEPLDYFALYPVY